MVTAAAAAAAEVDRTLAALADPARRAIVELIGHGPRRPSDVADRLALTRPALSRHLRVLRQAGLIDERIAADDARGRIVELRRERFAGLRTWLDEVEGFWSDQLAAFKAHAERGAGRAVRPRSKR